MRMVLAIISMLLAGCNVFDVHPYDCNIKGERDINRKNAARIEQALATSLDLPLDNSDNLWAKSRNPRTECLARALYKGVPHNPPFRLGNIRKNNPRACPIFPLLPYRTILSRQSKL